MTSVPSLLSVPAVRFNVRIALIAALAVLTAQSCRCAVADNGGGAMEAVVASTAQPLSYNERYNEIVKPSFVQQIDAELPKEGKFFDDFDCKWRLSIKPITDALQLRFIIYHQLNFYRTDRTDYNIA